MLRDVPSYGVYFAAFELVNRLYVDMKGLGDHATRSSPVWYLRFLFYCIPIYIYIYNFVKQHARTLLLFLGTIYIEFRALVLNILTRS